MSGNEQMKHPVGQWVFMSVNTWARCKGPRQRLPIAYVGNYVVTTLEPSHTSHADSEEIANFICHAVNYHPEILAALSAIAQRANESGTGANALLETIHAMHEIARAAITKTEGRTP